MGDSPCCRKRLRLLCIVLKHPSTYCVFFFFFINTPPPKIYPLPLPAPLPISDRKPARRGTSDHYSAGKSDGTRGPDRHFLRGRLRHSAPELSMEKEWHGRQRRHFRFLHEIGRAHV